MPEGGSADLEIPASRAGNGAGGPEGRPAAALGRLEGEAAGDLAFPRGTTVPPGKRLQVSGSPLMRKGLPFRFRTRDIGKMLMALFDNLSFPSALLDLWVTLSQRADLLWECLSHSKVEKENPVIEGSAYQIPEKELSCAFS